MKLPGAIGCGALSIVICACIGCGYADFRLPALAPAEPK